MASNKLTINYSKTKFMLIRSDHRENIGEFYINMDGNPIERINCFKYLGIEIDDNLSWKTHIRSLETEISRVSRFICKLRHYVDFDCLKNFYFAKVYSKIQYAILAWGGCCDSKLRKLNVLHNNIIRIMTLKNMPLQIRLSTKTLFKSINILQLNDIFQLELAKFMHRASSDDLPQNLNHMFTRISSVHRYPTSSSRKRVFVKPLTNKAIYRNWISSTGISLWEKIDPALKKMSYLSFKKAYRSHIIDCYWTLIIPIVFLLWAHPLCILLIEYRNIPFPMVYFFRLYTQPVLIPFMVISPLIYEFFDIRRCLKNVV